MNPSQSLRGVQFPIDQNAVEQIKAFAKGDVDFVQLSIDTLNEALKLEDSQINLPASELSARISRNKPRYSFYRLRETDDSPIFFIYSIPPTQSCTIKELMLYSSCKSPFLSEVQKDLGVQISKKIEVDAKDRLNVHSLKSYLRVEREESTPSPRFDRPQRPGRGPVGPISVQK